MDYYSREGLMRERHEEMVHRAEDLGRLQQYESGERFADRIAAQLRRLADRIDGRQQPRVWIHPG
jgi:hypothetical protein